jgi:signal transduction histidine kinase
MDQSTRGVLAVARAVLNDLDSETVLQQVLAAARELTGAKYAALGVLSESRIELGRFITLGLDDATRRAIGSPPKGRGVLGELIGERTPLRLADVSRHPHSYGFPPGHPPMRTFLGVPILIGEEPFGNLYLTDKEGGEEFTDADEEAAVLLADFAGVAIDHARRFTDSETRRLELQRTVNALDATIQIARAVGGETDLMAILELVAKRGRALVSARALVIELLVGDELVVAEGAGELPDDLIGHRVKLENTVASAALRVGQTQWLSDEVNRARFEQYGIGRLGLRANDGLIVPLIFRNQRYGVLAALDRLDGSQFTSQHQQLLESFAASAATAVATAHSAAEERSRQRMAATEAERTRWARELHDETLQALANLSLVLGAARRARDPERMADAIAQATDQLETDIANLRALITELRPAALDELGVEAALTALAERATQSGLAVDVNIDLAGGQEQTAARLIPELEAAIYRIVQEALTNAASHGGAARAVVEVVENDRFVEVTVRDDGRGFDANVKTDGFGLVGMRERADMFGGTLEVKSSPGGGTTIAARLPVRMRDTATPLTGPGLLVPRSGT